MKINSLSVVLDVNGELFMANIKEVTLLPLEQYYAFSSFRESMASGHALKVDPRQQTLPEDKQ